MTPDAMASNGLPGFLVHDTISVPPTSSIFSGAGGGVGDGLSFLGFFGLDDNADVSGDGSAFPAERDVGVVWEQGRRKRRRRPRSYKNKEEAESQRMTHIAVERNRRRLMNEHLAELRSLMPESYGDQASIVGGAIDFVKELEQLLQSLEAQSRELRRRRRSFDDGPIKLESGGSGDEFSDELPPPFGTFFSYPQYAWCHAPRDHLSPAAMAPAAMSVADIEVTLIETHASLRVLTPRRPRQLIRLVAGLHALRLAVLHLNVTAVEGLVLYSLSTKVEEGCHFVSVDDIAAAVHHILFLVEAGCLSQ